MPKHIAYEFFRPCGCLRGAFVDVGHYSRAELASVIGEYIMDAAETRVVRRELDDGELLAIGGGCPHSAVTE